MRMTLWYSLDGSEVTQQLSSLPAPVDTDDLVQHPFVSCVSLNEEELRSSWEWALELWMDQFEEKEDVR